MADSEIHAVCPMDELIDVVDADWISEKLVNDQVEIHDLLRSSLREVQLSLPGCTKEIVQRIELLGPGSGGTLSSEIDGFYIDLDEDDMNGGGSGGGDGGGGLTSSAGNSRGGGGGSGGGAGGGGSGGGRANNSTMDNESVIYASLSGFDSDEDEDDEGEDGGSGGGMTAMRRMRHREDIMASMTSLGQQWNELDLDTFHHMFDDGSRTASHTMMAPPVILIPGTGKNEDNPLER